MTYQGESLFNKEYLDEWYSNYWKLKPYVSKNEFTTVDIDKELAQWVSIQRRIRHLLPGELKEKLEELRFVIEETTCSWNAMYRQLSLFVQETGHTSIPDDEKHEQLKDWLMRQIINKKLLSESQLQQLDKLEVDWDIAISRDHRWNQMYWRLNDFYTTFGHCRVPRRWPTDKQLALWVIMQRKMHMKCKLSEDRERRLNELKFIWSIRDVYDAQWEKFYQQLVAYSRRYGHCRVPYKHTKLVSWIERQRLSRQKHQLPQDRYKRLEEIGFTWNCDDMKRRSWEERYEQLEEYKKANGHCFVPTNYRENKSLGIWVATQRRLEAKGKLQEAKKKRLDQLGFVWGKRVKHKLQSVYDKQWNDNFKKLKAYRQEHGSCQVSLKLDPVLQQWTSWQRKLFYQGKLSLARINRLNEIHFPWSLQEEYWMKMYEALAEFKVRFGHTRVPFRWEPNPQLSAWVYRMRLSKLDLSTQKIELLEQIGFIWTLSRRSILPWKTMYNRLVEFQQGHGHTRVPVKWQEDPKLGKWVSRMRQERGKLDPERVLLLEAIGFDWGHRFNYKKNTRTNS
ncbi:helicase associated domain-containing protein [Pontibacter pamirensis]|uniref:helicase associated domain-containing protein n=1 Tax=Pontibacter pamirensis TaxID=2562824 RepID=UPI00138A6210|nr:helicase associated domain-containing protein [Pontibacter pamirensis]